MTVYGWKRFIVFLSGMIFLFLVSSIVCLFLYNQLLKSRFWAVRAIYISGNKVLSDEQILRTINIPDNTSIWAIRLTDIRKKLESLVWVDRASLKWKFPGKLHIEIFEKIPFIVVCSPGGCYYVDKEGILFERCNRCEHSRYKMLVPDIRQITRRYGKIMILRGDFRDSVRELLKAVAKNDGICDANSVEIEYRKDTGFVIKTNLLKAILGNKQFELKLHILSKLLEFLERLKKRVDFSVIDLRYRNYILIKQDFSKKG